MKLAKDSVVPVPAGSLVVVERGTLWLTQCPDPTDYFLGAGESMRLARDGSPLVSALRDSVFRVATVARSPRRWREVVVGLALRMRLA
jgi:hypothetical protein